MTLRVLRTSVAVLLSLGLAATGSASTEKVLLKWTSRQQMNWRVRVEAKGFQFKKVLSARLDAGGPQIVLLSSGGDALEIVSGTSWNTGTALVAVEVGSGGDLVVHVSDPYVDDRATSLRCSLADLKKGRTLPVDSKQWPMTGCSLTLTTDAATVGREERLLKALGSDRRKNVAALLSAADKAGDKVRRVDLLFRAAAACTGGCNHGPLRPDGWDRAIAIYQKVIDEFKGTNAELDAMWMQAACHACWSPEPGCDADGRGKAASAGREAEDWEKACALYEKLYRVSLMPADKADALRRMAELQCYVMGSPEDGLATYKRLAVEFPGALPPSVRVTYRTCAPHCGTDGLAWDIFRALVATSKDAKTVRSRFDAVFGGVKGNPVIEELAKMVQGIPDEKAAKREGSKVWLAYKQLGAEQGVAGLRHIRRIADVLRYHGEDVDFDWLMGASGEAFAYYYHPDGTYLTPFVHSWDSALAGLAAFGYAGEWMTSPRGTSVDSTLQAVEKEIASGRIVIAPGIKAGEDGVHSMCHYWWLVTGVDAANRTVQLAGSSEFVPLPTGDSDDPAEHPRWYGIVRAGDQHYGDNPILMVKQAWVKPKAGDVVRAALERALSADAQAVDLRNWGGGHYLAGVAAMERMLSDLEAAKGQGVEEFKRLNPVKGDPYGGIHEELIHLRLLCEGRRSAAIFLKQAAPHLAAEARAHLEAAAAQYGDVARLAEATYELRHGPVNGSDPFAESPAQETQTGPKWEAFWKRADENLADPAKRREMADLLRKLVEAERQGLAELKKALASPWEWG